MHHVPLKWRSRAAVTRSRLSIPNLSVVIWTDGSSFKVIGEVPDLLVTYLTVPSWGFLRRCTPSAACESQSCDGVKLPTTIILPSV